MDSIDWSKHKAVRRTCAYPSDFNEKRFTIQQLKEAAKRADILFRGRPFIKVRRFDSYDKAVPQVVGNGIETIINEPNLVAPYIEQWNLLRSGAFLHRTVMFELHDQQWEGQRVLDVIETMHHIAEAIGSLWRMYEALDIPNEEEVTIEFVYEDTEGRKLNFSDPRRKFRFFSVGDPLAPPKIEISHTFPLQIWRASDVQIAAEICLEIFEKFQWEPSLQQLQQEIGTFLGRTPASAR